MPMLTSQRRLTSALALAALTAVAIPLAAHDFPVLPNGLNDERRATIPVPLQVATDSAAVVAVVDRYHRALAAGDSAAALALLTPDAVILESGGIESRAEYRSHHLEADIAFARAVRRERGPIQVKVRGDVAWASSTNTMTGQYGGRAINSQGAELMILTRVSDGWRISAVHWSSRNRTSP